jgi:hypothetical protein
MTAHFGHVIVCRNGGGGRRGRLLNKTRKTGQKAFGQHLHKTDCNDSSVSHEMRMSL